MQNSLTQLCPTTNEGLTHDFQLLDNACPHLEAIRNFFNAFPRPEAHQLLHKMMRAAFAREDILSKRDIKDLIFLKDELVKLIAAAAALAKEDAHKPQLSKFFRCWTLGEWTDALDMLFYAAIYDSFCTCPLQHKDIYHYCRGLHALLKAGAACTE